MYNFSRNEVALTITNSNDHHIIDIRKQAGQDMENTERGMQWRVAGCLE
jgi:hypothetical protein